MLAKYVNFNNKLHTKSNYKNVNFITGKDSNYNYYKMKYTTRNKEQIKQLEDFVASMKDDHKKVSIAKKENDRKKIKPVNGKDKLKGFITSLNISRPVSKSTSREEVMSKDYNDNVKKELFTNDIVLSKIVSHFDLKKDTSFLINNLMLLNKQINKIVIKRVYTDVSFESTYKLAQFLNTIKADLIKPHGSKNLNAMVESIDLSGIKSGSELFKIYCEKMNIKTNDSLGDMSLATWRDWRMKDSKIYGRNLSEMQHTMRKRTISTTSVVSIDMNQKKKAKLIKSQMSSNIDKFIDKFWSKKRKIKKNSGTLMDIGKIIKPNNQLGKIKHPLINLHHQKYKDNRDVPIGYIIHILKYFGNLKVFNLNHLSISEDFIFLKDLGITEEADLDYIKEYFLGRSDDFKFLSDTGINSFNLTMDKNIFGLTFSNFFEIFIHLVNNKELRSLSLRHCYFVKKNEVGKLLSNQYTMQNDMKIDLYKSTMNKNYLWCNTPIVDSNQFLILFFMSNLIDNVRKQDYRVISSFSKKSFSNTDEYVFKSDYFTLHGVLSSNNSNDLSFKICYGLNQKGAGFDCHIETSSNKITIILLFELDTYMETNNIFLTENEFFNFHNNMSLLRLGESIRNEDTDPRYYNLNILGEYLLTRIKIDYLMLKRKTIGYNMIKCV